MTHDNEMRLASAVENTWFKGVSRLSMIVLTLFGAPLVYSVVSRTYDTIDRLDRSLTKIDGQIERIELSATNDRRDVTSGYSAMSARIDIISARVTETQHDFSRVNDVISGFTLRDQRLDALEKRIISIEGRVFQRAEPR